MNSTLDQESITELVKTDVGWIEHEHIGGWSGQVNTPNKWQLKKGSVGTKNLTAMPKAWQLEKDAKFKKGDMAKPVKNTPSQDRVEGEQDGRSDLWAVYSTPARASRAGGWLNSALGFTVGPHK